MADQSHQVSVDDSKPYGMDTIRDITRNQYKELGELLDSGFTKVPVFGFPQFCFTPARHTDNTPEEEKESLWKHLSRTIFENLPEGKQMKIRELLDCYDDKQDNMNEILSRFSQGKLLVAENSEKGLPRESKRAIKRRETIDLSMQVSAKKKRVVVKQKIKKFKGDDKVEIPPHNNKSLSVTKQSRNTVN